MYLRNSEIRRRHRIGVHRLAATLAGLAVFMVVAPGGQHTPAPTHGLIAQLFFVQEAQAGQRIDARKRYYKMQMLRRRALAKQRAMRRNRLKARTRAIQQRRVQPQRRAVPQRRITRTTPPRTQQVKTQSASSGSQPTSDIQRRSTRHTKRRANTLGTQQPGEVPRTLVGIFNRMAKESKKSGNATRTNPFGRNRAKAVNRELRRERRRKRIAAARANWKKRRHKKQKAEVLPWNPKPALADAQPKPSPTPVVGSAAASTQATVTPAVQPIRQLRRRVRRKKVIGSIAPTKFGSTGTTIRNELLVERLDGNRLKLLQQLGFAPLSDNTGAQSQAAVTRLQIPEGSQTQTAFALLSDLFSDLKIHYNRRYRPYRSAQGDANSGWETTISSNGHTSCDTEHCYGPASIQWSSNASHCATGLRIGVIDTAIDSRHKTFAGKSITFSRLASGRQPQHGDGHGTGVLALLAGRSQSTTPGLVPGAEFYAADIFFADADGETASDSLSLHKALLQMEAWGVHVVNLSLSGPRDSLVEKTMKRLSKKGMIFVAAGGNGGPAAEASYPAAYSDVIAVTAVDRSRRSYRYANRGSYIDVAAPGVKIWTAAPGQKEGLMSGTSLAVPFMTSIVAALYTSLPRKNRTSVLRMTRTLDLGPVGKDHIYGYGLVQAPRKCAAPGNAQLASARVQ